jgi:hypothetical protein
MNKKQFEILNRSFRTANKQLQEFLFDRTPEFEGLEELFTPEELRVLERCDPTRWDPKDDPSLHRHTPKRKEELERARIEAWLENRQQEVKNPLVIE